MGTNDIPMLVEIIQSQYKVTFNSGFTMVEYGANEEDVMNFINKNYPERGHVFWIEKV